MLSFLERRLLPPLFHEVVGKHGQTIGERLPRLLLRANDERIASALNLDFVAFQLKFAGNPYGLLPLIKSLVFFRIATVRLPS